MLIVDDCKLNDGSGSSNNDLMGDTRGEWCPPTDNGAYSEWDGSDGDSVDNYALVNDPTPNDDTGYLSAQTVGVKDLHTFQAPHTTGAIRCVQHIVAARKTDTATKTFVSISRAGGTDRDHALGHNPGQVTYDYYRSNYELNPDTGLPFDPSELGPTGVQFGPKVTQ